MDPPARIKVMHDWDCWPLWRQSGRGPYNLDPAEPPISAALASALNRWASDCDAQLNREDPAATQIDDDLADSLDQRGRALAQQLADTLGAEVEVLWKAPGAPAEPITPSDGADTR